MKILHVADLHLRWFDWVKSYATSFDLIVIAGDLQDSFSNLSFQAQAQLCTEWLLSLPNPTIVCSGNHDLWGTGQYSIAEREWLPRLSSMGKVLATDGQTVEFRGQTITTVGWNQQPLLQETTNIVVAHAPPAECWCASEEYSSLDLGDIDLRVAVLRHPTTLLILSGHVHEPRRKWSRMPNGNLVLVPGCNMNSPQPYHWVIDTTTKLAMWHGYPDDPVEPIPLLRNRRPDSD